MYFAVEEIGLRQWKVMLSKRFQDSCSDRKKELCTIWKKKISQLESSWYANDCFYTPFLHCGFVPCGMSVVTTDWSLNIVSFSFFNYKKSATLQTVMFNKNWLQYFTRLDNKCIKCFLTSVNYWYLLHSSLIWLLSLRIAEYIEEYFLL